MLEKIRYLTAVESHGKGLLGIIDGIPSGLTITKEYIAEQLSRRQMGYGRSNRMKIESDIAEIYCGVRLGKTLGGPIGLIISNNDHKNWTEQMSVTDNKYSKKITLPRPGHADLAGVMKFGFDDIRNVIERSSARETAMRVALSSICRSLLDEIEISVFSRVVQIHNINDNTIINTNNKLLKVNKLADNSPVRCINKTAEKKMIKAIDCAKKNGDSVGGIIEIYCSGLPYGLGSYSQWDKKLQSKISETILSINAFKGIEFGMGFNSAAEFGSKVHDEIGIKNNTFIRKSNNAGGIEGGMSNSQPLVIRVSMKIKKAHKERTDSCAVPSASIIAENLLCIVLVDSILSKFGGDSMEQLKMHINKSARF